MYTSAPGHTVDCSEFMWGIDTDIVVSCAHELICIFGIYMEFERFICCWQINGNTMWSKYCSCLHFGTHMQNVGSVYAYNIMDLWFIFAMWQPYLFSVIKYVYRDTRLDIWYTCITQACIHAYICTLIHTYIHLCLCMSGYTYAYMYTFIFACVHTCVYIHTSIQAYRHIFACLPSYISACMQLIYMDALINRCMHA